jgi:hypothetical protein
MRRSLHIIIAAIAAHAMATATAAPAEEPRANAAPSFNQASVARSIDAARQAREHGDVMAAERLCYAAFQSVDDSALAAYDAFADRLKVEHRAEESTVRAQAARLHELKQQQLNGTKPTSTYLGFSTAGGLQAYADLLRSLGEIDDAERVRALALAYQQVQQAHFQRTQLFQQGKDPRGSC